MNLPVEVHRRNAGVRLGFVLRNDSQHRNATEPTHEVGVLGASCAKVTGDHSQPTREGPDRSRILVSGAVVGDGTDGSHTDRLAFRTERIAALERRHPVAGPVGSPRAVSLLGEQRRLCAESVSRRVPEEVVQMARAGMPGWTIGSLVARWVNGQMTDQLPPSCEICAVAAAGRVASTESSDDERSGALRQYRAHRGCALAGPLPSQSRPGSVGSRRSVSAGRWGVAGLNGATHALDRIRRFSERRRRCSNHQGVRARRADGQLCPAGSSRYARRGYDDRRGGDGLRRAAKRSRSRQSKAKACSGPACCRSR